MSKIVMRALALSAALVFGAAAADAAPLLSFSPSSQNVNIGDPASVDIVISGLAVDEEIGSFDLDITYNSAVVSFVDYTLGTGLGAGGDIIDLSLGDLGGLIDVAVLSLLDEADLKPLQGGGFVLATLNFTAVANGVSALTLPQSIFADGAGVELLVDADRGAIRVGDVPEPASLLLLGAGAMALVARRRARRG